MKRFNRLTVLSAIWLSALASLATADVRLPKIFGDNMVLQQEAEVPVWGWAGAGQEVAVTFCNQSQSTKADETGKWTVKLEALKAGGPFEMTVKANNTITLKNILVGEVWVCSGQSNMYFPVLNSANGKEEVAKADYPKIRLFAVDLQVADEPKDDVKGQWDVCNPDTVKFFSAVGYFFGREMHKALDVPVGLIRSAVGGTPAEAWTSMPTLKSDPAFKPIFDRWDRDLALYPKKMKNFSKALAKWKERKVNPYPAGLNRQRAPDIETPLPVCTTA